MWKLSDTVESGFFWGVVRGIYTGCNVVSVGQMEDLVFCSGERMSTLVENSIIIRCFKEMHDKIYQKSGFQVISEREGQNDVIGFSLLSHKKKCDAWICPESGLFHVILFEPNPDIHG